MNLISCDGCGVVFDADKLYFPNQDDFINDDGSINTDFVDFDDDGRTIPVIHCRFCGERIQEPKCTQ